MRSPAFFALLVAVSTAVLAQQPAAPAPLPPGISRTALMDNGAALVARLRFAPDARETVHTHPFSAVVIQISPGIVTMHVGDATDTLRREPGAAWFLSKEVPHAAANAGQFGFDVVTLALKPRTGPPYTEPASAPVPAGIHRQVRIDNPDTRVVHVTFDPGAREVVHSHPYDLFVVPLTDGRMEVLVGQEKTAKRYGPGDVFFLPKQVPHAVATLEPNAIEFMSVAVK